MRLIESGNARSKQLLVMATEQLINRLRMAARTAHSIGVPLHLPPVVALNKHVHMTVTV